MSDIRECDLCNGTGIDEADFTGKCFRCRGLGEVDVGISGEWSGHDDDDGFEDPEWDD